MADGVDVVLDQWSLKDGHDINAFMEQMVLGATIKRVLVVSDTVYAQKANARKGGVGTESQIISPEVYNQVEQEKFIPIVRERFVDGKPALPVFLKDRKYLDFSSTDAESSAYEQLLRNIFERPLVERPPIGRPPAHLFDDTAILIPSAQKAKRFQEAVVSGRGNPAAAFQDFAEQFVQDLESLRLIYTKDKEAEWCQILRDNIGRGQQYRDILVETVRCGAFGIRDDWFIEALLQLLERVLPFRSRPHSTTHYFEASEDNYKFLLYEGFLYAVACFCKARRFEDARKLLDHTYISTENFGGGSSRSRPFTTFNDYNRSLDEHCCNAGNSRRLSVTADLVVERANRTDITMADVLQADVVCMMAGLSLGQYDGWFPRTLIYGGRVGTFELFARAINAQGIKPLLTLLGVANAGELVALIGSPRVARVLQSEKLWHASVDFVDLLNLKAIQRAWKLIPVDGGS